MAVTTLVVAPLVISGSLSLQPRLGAAASGRLAAVPAAIAVALLAVGTELGPSATTTMALSTAAHVPAQVGLGLVFARGLCRGRTLTAAAAAGAATFAAASVLLALLPPLLALALAPLTLALVHRRGAGASAASAPRTSHRARRPRSYPPAARSWTSRPDPLDGPTPTADAGGSPLAEATPTPDAGGSPLAEATPTPDAGGSPLAGATPTPDADGPALAGATPTPDAGGSPLDGAARAPDPGGSPLAVAVPAPGLGEILGSGLAALVLVLCVTAVARAAGPTLAGALGAFPAVTAVLAGVTSRRAGPAAAALVLRGMVRGMPAYLAFCLGTAAAASAGGPGTAIAVGLAAASVVASLDRGRARGVPVPATPVPPTVG